MKTKFQIFSCMMSSDNLKNIVTNEDGNTSTTIIAKNGIVETKQLILFDGIIISTKDNIENDIVTFEQIKVNLSALTNTTIKQPKIQETSTLKLLGCANNNFLMIEIVKEILKRNFTHS